MLIYVSYSNIQLNKNNNFSESRNRQACGTNSFLQGNDLALGTRMGNCGLLLCKNQDRSERIGSNNSEVGTTGRLGIPQIIRQTNNNPMHNGEVISTIANETLQRLFMCGACKKSDGEVAGRQWTCRIPCAPSCRLAKGCYI